MSQRRVFQLASLLIVLLGAGTIWILFASDDASGPAESGDERHTTQNLERGDPPKSELTPNSFLSGSQQEPPTPAAESVDSGVRRGDADPAASAIDDTQAVSQKNRSPLSSGHQVRDIEPGAPELNSPPGSGNTDSPHRATPHQRPSEPPLERDSEVASEREAVREPPPVAAQDEAATQASTELVTLRISLIQAAAEAIGALQLQLDWDGAALQPFDSQTVCSDLSSATLFQQGRLEVGSLSLGMLYIPGLSKPTPLLDCTFLAEGGDPTLIVRPIEATNFAGSAIELSTGSFQIEYR